MTVDMRCLKTAVREIENHVVRLQKKIHGSRQALRKYYKILHNASCHLRCEQSTSGPSHYDFIKHVLFSVFVVYVNDTLLFSEQSAAFKWMINHFKEKFKVKISRNSSKYLGFSIEVNGVTVKLQNDPIIKRTMTKFEMQNYGTDTTLFPVGICLGNTVKFEWSD